MAFGTRYSQMKAAAAEHNNNYVSKAPSQFNKNQPVRYTNPGTTVISVNSRLKHNICMF